MIGHESPSAGGGGSVTRRDSAPPGATGARGFSFALLAIGALLVAFSLLADPLRGRPLDFGTQQEMIGILGAALLAEGWLRLRTGESLALWRLVISDRRAGFLVALGFGLCLLGLQIQAYHRFFLDDTFITYRYGSNLARGYGVTWNPGEAPVEGFSNFLWMLMSAAVQRMGGDPLLVSRIVSGLCLAASLVAIRQLAAAVTGTTRWANLATLAMAAIPAFGYWAMSGLETQSTALLAILYFLAFHHDFQSGRWPWRTALCADLLYVSRPDTPLLLLLSAVPLVFGRDRRAWLWLGKLAVLAAPVVLAFQGWRWMHFGRLFPNTVAAKWAPLQGIEMMLEYLTLAFPFLLVALAGMSRTARTFERQILVVAFGFLLALMNVVPHVAHFGRLFLPVLAPLVAMLPIVCVRWELTERPSGPDPARATAIGFTAFTLLMLFSMVPLQRMAIYGQNETDGYEKAHVPLAQVLKRNFRPEARLAIAECGVIPYYCDLRTTDIWGLSDRRIAEHGFDAGYVMAAHPDAIVLHSYDSKGYLGKDDFEVKLYAAMQAEGSWREVGRWYYYGYWLVLYTRGPIH